jgi:TonB-dependent SusC/RagA subfamily outer membrane receptor
MFFAKGNSAKAQGDIKRTTAGGVQTITAADLDKIRTADVCNALAGKVRPYVVISNKTITGKVTDKDGNPVAFASVKIKGTSMGVSADANGAYSLKLKPNAILVISGASFKETEVVVGSQSFINTVMEKDPNYILKEVVVTMAICTRRRPVSEDNKIVNAKPVVIFEVKEDNTGLPIDKAAITINRKGYNFSDKIISDNKGIYKFTEIKMNDSYFIKVEAEGYEPNEFSIEAKDVKDREKAWEVLLRKQKVQPVKSTSIGKTGAQNIIRLGGISAVNKSTEPLYVVDGTIRSYKPEINPDDIEDITVVQGPAAAALFGPDGANGAIIITTRKSKEIKMNEVVVSSEFSTRRTTRGGVSYTNTYENSFLGDTIATVKTLLNNSIKVYPNPVQRNTAFSVALKLKQAGNYSMQVTDVSGRILLQQKFNAISKDHTEKIMGDSRWAAGVYYIRVFDNKNQLISKTSFIFE